MKKNFFNFLFCSALFLVLATFISCGGGGGGGGSASLFMPENELRNGGTGGWGGSGNRTNSSGAPASNLVLTGGTSLDVDYYVYNGQRYNTAEELLAVLTAQVTADGTYSVDVYVSGEISARPGRYVVSGDRRTLQHPYKIKVTDKDGGLLYSSDTSATGEYFYSSEGFPMSNLSATSTVTETCGGASSSISFPVTGWNVDGQTVALDGKITGFTGDKTFTATEAIPKYTISNDTLAFSSACQNETNLIIIPSGTQFSSLALSDNIASPIKLDLSAAELSTNTQNEFSSGILMQQDMDKVSYIKLPNTITVIGANAFSGNNTLETVIIPNSVTEIAGSAFYGCATLQTIDLPDNLQTIGINAFNLSGLQSINIPASVTTIESGAFNCCYSLQTLTFASGSQLQTIGANAFYECTSLTGNLTIPASVTTIKAGAFTQEIDIYGLRFEADPLNISCEPGAFVDYQQTRYYAEAENRTYTRYFLNGQWH